jgi:hypothetical protein
MQVVPVCSSLFKRVEPSFVVLSWKTLSPLCCCVAFNFSCVSVFLCSFLHSLVSKLAGVYI